MSENVIRGGQKKVWRFLTVTPDHVPGQYICIQELDGHWEDPDPTIVDDDGWRDAEVPIATRVVLMKMDKDGGMRNVNSPYNGDRYTQRNQ
jgi:hypothetical protein